MLHSFPMQSPTVIWVSSIHGIMLLHEVMKLYKISFQGNVKVYNTTITIHADILYRWIIINAFKYRTTPRKFPHLLAVCRFSCVKRTCISIRINSCVLFKVALLAMQLTLAGVRNQTQRSIDSNLKCTCIMHPSASSQINKCLLKAFRTVDTCISSTLRVFRHPLGHN